MSDVVDANLWLHLLDRDGGTKALVEFVVRREHVTVWWRRQTLACIPRGELRAWLLAPDDPFTTDELVWTMDGYKVTVSIRGSSPLPLPDSFTVELASLV